MEKIVFSASLIGVYAYVLAVLHMSGYESYFNIPPTYIEASLRANIINLSSLMSGLWSIAMRHVIIISLLLIASLFYKEIKIKIGSRIQHKFKLLKRLDFRFIKYTTALLFVLILIPFQVYESGVIRAQNQSWFDAPEEECERENSIIPVTYGGQAVFVGINEEKKLTGEFWVENITDMNCKITTRFLKIAK